jgi:octaprenyl-diphosphate synthase
MNFGIAFQIVDDYLDLVGQQRTLGKTAGQDIACGEITLPILHLMELLSSKERQELRMSLLLGKNKQTLKMVRKMLVDFGAAKKTKQEASSYILQAKDRINILSHSPYKDGLLSLADFVINRGFGSLKG